jgi:hypothetical protein
MKHRDPLQDIGLDDASLELKQRFARDRPRAEDPRPLAAPPGNQSIYNAEAQMARGKPGGAWAPRVTASAKDATTFGAGASMRSDSFGVSASSSPGLTRSAAAAAAAVAARNAQKQDFKARERMSAPPVEPAPVEPGILPPAIPAPAAPPSRAGQVLAFVGGAFLGALIAKALR